MPVLGARPRELQRAAAPPSGVPARPTPLLPTPAPSFGPGVGSSPFAQQLAQARQNVQRTTAAGPKRATPAIPRLANPTPQQTHAALALVAHSQRLALGANPTQERVRAYQQELANDPRQRDFLETVRHYVSAAEQHVQALEGRRLLWGALEGSHSPSEARTALSRVSDAEARSIAQNHGAYLLPNLLRSAQRQELAAGLPSLAQGERQAAAEQQSGKGGPLDLGFINLTPIVSAAANLKVPGLGGLPGKVINEAIDLPAQTFLSSAIAGSAVSQAFEKETGIGAGAGSYGPAQALAKSVLGQVNPLNWPHNFEQAPISTALTAAGVEAGVGGLLARLGEASRAGLRPLARAEALVRKPTGAPRPDLKLYGEPTPAPSDALAVRQRVTGDTSPVRAPQRTGERIVTGTGEGVRVVGRRYNPDPIRAALQRAGEAAQRSAGRDPFQASGVRFRREAAGGLFKVGKADREVAAAEHTRRQFRSAPLHATAADGATLTRNERELASLTAQRVLRTPATMRADLAKEIARTRAAQHGLSPSELQKNKLNLKRLEAAAADQTLRPHAIHDVAEAFTDRQRYLGASKVHGGAINEEQLRAALFPYAQAHMGATYSKGALRGADGTVLGNDAIKAHMRAAGVAEPAYVTHVPPSNSFFYRPVSRFPALSRARTGSAFAKGIADHSFSALLASIAKDAGSAAQLEVRPRLLNRQAIRPSSGGFMSKEAAAKYAEDNLHTTPQGEPIKGVRYVPVHLGANPYIEAGAVHPADVQGTLRQFGLHEYQPPFAKENGKWGLIPESVAHRLAQHEQALSTNSDLAKGLQRYQQAFRKAKLNTSVPHIFGVPQEQAIRLLFEGAGPRSYLTGRKVMRVLSEAAELDRHGQLLADAGPLGASMRALEAKFGARGQLVSSQRETDVVRKGDAAAMDTIPGKVAQAGSAFAHAPVGRAMAAPWHALQFLVEGGLRQIEHGTFHAMIGKALRDSGFITNFRDVLGAQDQAVHALIEGKMTPNMADALAQRVNDMAGNWSQQTPVVRKVVGHIAPFGLWWLNSLRWLYRLPVTHPVKAGILGALYQATREARNAKGQGFDAAHPVPSFLQGTIEVHGLPLVGSGRVGPTYYSPGGTLGPEAGKTAADLLLPALRPLVAAAEGQNPLSGAKLETAQKRPLKGYEDALNVLSEVLSGPLPFATQAEKALTMGGKPYGTSNLLTDIAAKLGGAPQVKPGTERPPLQVLGKMFFPTRFDFPKAGASATGAPAANPQLTPAQAARVQRAIERAGDSRVSPAQEARIKRAEERYAAREGR